MNFHQQYLQQHRSCKTMLQIVAMTFLAITSVTALPQLSSGQSAPMERYPIGDMMRRHSQSVEQEQPIQQARNSNQFPPAPSPNAQSERVPQSAGNQLRSKAVDLPVALPDPHEASVALATTTEDPAVKGDTREPARDGEHPKNSNAASKRASASAGTPAKTVSTATNLPTRNTKPAAQPKLGDHFDEHPPCTDKCVVLLPYEQNDFAPDPIDPYEPVDPWAEIEVYEGKSLICTQRPLVELGRRFYDYGQYYPSSTLLGGSNLLAPSFLIYGDWRTAAASNNQNGNELTQIATRLNLDIDLKLTATERFHAFVRPFDTGNQFTRIEFDNGTATAFDELDFEFDTGFFEGDLGAIVGGLTGDVLPFDFPFAVGQIPLVLQNGIWLEDAFLGIAATLPARHNKFLDISNFDTTFFYGFDNITSPVFQGDDDAAKMYGLTSFLEAWDGYIETGYVFLEDRRNVDRSYHNVALGYTRRYGKRLSNSIRVIANAGQDPTNQGANADGMVLLLENSLISRKPYSVVPYFNMFAGFGRPQSVARAGGTGGILRNTGINFESDGLTNYPTLDATANESFGGALGINLLGDNLNHQLIFEFAFLQTMGDDPLRPAVDDQYAVGARYQKPLSTSVLIRADAMYGFLDNDNDISGMRLELRKKF